MPSGAALTGAGSGAAAGAAFGPWGAAIGAGVGLLGGLMSDAANREEEARRRKLEGQLMGLNTQAQAAQAMTTGQQNAFAQMMQGYTAAYR